MKKKVVSCDGIPRNFYNIMKTIGEHAEKRGVKCYAVGGFVRDYLMGKKPDDLDVVCTDIEPVADALISKKIGRDLTGEKGITKERFRTKILEINGKKIDLVEPRREEYTPDSIKPKVSKGTIKDDIMRRDFTVNTLYMGMSPSDMCTIYDLTGKGLDDLDNRIIRTPRNPNVVFTEDPSRMLRAIRFAACHNMIIEPKTDEYIKKHSDEVKRVPPDLMHKEIVKGSKCTNYFRFMHDKGLMKPIFPEVERLKNIKQKPEHHTTDALEHTLRVIEFLPPDPILKMSALLHDIGKYETTDENLSAHEHEKVSEKLADPILRRIKFGKEDRAKITRLIREHMSLHLMDKNPTDRAIRRFIINKGDILPQLAALSRADVISDSTDTENQLRELDSKIAKIIKMRDSMAELTRNKIEWAINGHDVMKFGFRGRNVGTILNDIHNKVIDGILPNDRKALLKYIEKTYVPPKIAEPSAISSKK